MTRRSPSPGSPRTRWSGALAMSSVMMGLGLLAVRQRPAPTLPVTGTSPSMLPLGEQLLATDLTTDRASRFRLDGLRVSALRIHTDAPFEQVLHAAAWRCVDDVPIAPEALVERLRHPGVSSEAPPESPTVERRTLGSHGFVACLDLHAPPPGRNALRYVYARAAAHGTEVAVMWTDTVVRLADLRARTDGGDAPGDDVPAVPRPPGLRRTFSFVREDGGGELVVYAPTGHPGDLEGAFVEALRRAGWSEPRVSGGERGGRGLVADRDGRRVHIVHHADDSVVVVAGPIASP